MNTYVVQRHVFTIVNFSKQPHAFFNEIVEPFEASVAVTEAHGHRNAADDVRHAQGEERVRVNGCSLRAVQVGDKLIYFALIKINVPVSLMINL